MVSKEAWKVERERGSEPFLQPETVRKMARSHRVGTVVGKVLGFIIVLTFAAAAGRFLVHVWRWILAPL